MKKTDSVRLTEGVIWKQILAFAWPVLLSSIFQEVYNLTNSMIVGNYISTKALSAVSATSSLINILTFFFAGLATGTGIVVAQYYGANKTDKLKQSIGTVLILALLIGGGITIAMELLTPFLFRITNVGTEIYHDAEIYFRFFVLGSIAVLMYSMVFYLLRSIGDSRHPLYYLIFSCALNVVLGMLFIQVFHWEIAGVAIATILSELVVDVLSLRLLFRMDEFKLRKEDLKLDKEVAVRIISIGIPAAIQNMLIALSSMMIQSYINQFSVEAIAGIGVGQRVANWAQMPLIALSTVVSSFVGQNMGAGKYERVYEGVRFVVILSLFITGGCIALIYYYASDLIGLFDSDTEVIYYGTKMCRVLLPSYILLVFSHIYNSACRGAGNIRIPLHIAVFSQCVFRLIFVYVAFKFTDSINVIYLSGALCFSLAGVLAFVYYNYGSWTKNHHLRP